MNFTDETFYLFFPPISFQILAAGFQIHMKITAFKLDIFDNKLKDKMKKLVIIEFEIVKFTISGVYSIEFFLTSGLSLESNRHQFFSTIQDSSQYSRRS